MAIRSLAQTRTCGILGCSIISLAAAAPLFSVQSPSYSRFLSKEISFSFSTSLKALYLSLLSSESMPPRKAKEIKPEETSFSTRALSL
jgi:hypothetical protein